MGGPSGGGRQAVVPCGMSIGDGGGGASGAGEATRGRRGISIGGGRLTTSFESNQGRLANKTNQDNVSVLTVEK